MEHRVILSSKEATSLLEKATILETFFTIDTYDGTNHTRKTQSEVLTKPYPTPVVGTIYTFLSHCSIENCNTVWIEYKWTSPENHRFEVEFEETVLEEFKIRQNIPGWNFLINHERETTRQY